MNHALGKDRDFITTCTINQMAIDYWVLPYAGEFDKDYHYLYAQIQQIRSFGWDPMRLHNAIRSIYEGGVR